MSEVKPFIMDLIGCARCEGEGHEQIAFQPFTRPVEDYWTHWAMCPALHEPILFCTIKAP